MRGTVRRPGGRTRIEPEVLYGGTRREFLIGAGSVQAANRVLDYLERHLLE
jgi:hypothetical protein